VAVGTLTPDPQRLFRDYVLTNIQYWRDFVTDAQTLPAELDRGRQQIITAIRFAFDLDEAWPHTAALISAVSAYMERSGHWDVWQSVLTRAIETACAVEDNLTEVEFSALLARLLARKNQIEAAIRQHRCTIDLARRAGNRYNQARAYTNLGYLLIDYGHWWRSEVLCCTALQIFEQLDNQHGQAHTHNHLGVLYLRQFCWTQAQYHLERACDLWQAMGDDHGLMRGYVNLGWFHVETEQPSQIIEYSRKALHQADLTGEVSQIGAIYLNMSCAFRLQGAAKQAEAYARRAIKIFSQYEHSLYLPSAWINLGEALLDQGQKEAAGQYLEAALKEFQRLDYGYGEIKTLLALIEYDRMTDQSAQIDIWFGLAETRIAQLKQAPQRDHFQTLLDRYRPS
jgi:tetratricopeptide (TPR) repeat protein